MSAVDDATAVTFDDVPEVRDDLFAADNCEAGTDDRRVCRLYLRGYEHEPAAARFMARHGVRCPYQNARAPASPETFVARHDGTYYRISCAAHGDWDYSEEFFGAVNGGFEVHSYPAEWNKCIIVG